MTFTIPAFIAEAGGPYTGTKCNPVSFSGNATGGCGEPYTYSWTYGDGGSGTGQNPIYQYTNNGTYTTTLNIKDSQGNTASDTASVTISTPTLVAYANGLYEGYTGMSIDFEGNAIGGCTPYSYSWKFGDNQSSTQQNPTHTYSKPGVYTVILTVTDNNSDTDVDTTTATILSSNLDVDAGGPYYGEVDLSIQFTGSAFGGTSPYSYSWDFDDSDGIQVDSTLQSPTFIYGIPGVYNVTLTVTDDNGKTDTDTTTATIDEEPPEDIIPPTVEIIKPLNGLYFDNNRILPIGITFIVGGIDIQVNATDEGSGIGRVEFYLDNVLQGLDHTAPYSWSWNVFSFGQHNLRVIAYDNARNTRSEEIMVWKFF
ncbi:MAG: PKD domain-containing protein [Candidatus Thermoplasmatota archaeon]|nr:PKD domain-containing protein [Candidatus Thermoplasmatota archaeon]